MINPRPHILSAALAFAGLSLSAPAGAVAIGQVDDFEDGTTQGWIANLLGMGVHPAPPANVASGGPQGADDNYLLITSLGGAGPGSRMTALNPAGWAGDYTAAGVRRITLSVNNFGATDLSLRLMFEDALGGPPTNVAFTDSVFAAAGSGWVDISFDIGLSDLIAGLGTVADAMSAVTIMRLYHSPAPGFPNPVFPIPAIVASLGVDDITAIAEPAALALFGLGLTGLGLTRRRARRCDRRPMPRRPQGRGPSRR